MKGLAGFDIPDRKARIYDTSSNLAGRPLFHHGVCGGQYAARSGSDSQPCGFNLRREGCTQIAILEALGAGAGGGFTVEHVDVKKIKKEVEKA